MANSILGTIPLTQTAGLAGDNINFLKKKNKRSSDFIEQGVKNIVGIGLIGATANIINDL